MNFFFFLLHTGPWTTIIASMLWCLDMKLEGEYLELIFNFVVNMKFENVYNYKLARNMVSSVNRRFM